jgi:non-ribosomal peptide synthetase component F
LKPLFALVFLTLAGCAQDPYHWNLSHAAFAPSVRRLPEGERQEIVRLVSHATTEPLLRVGRSNYQQGVNIMQAVTGYHDHRVTMFTLTKTGGHWVIIDHEDSSVRLSNVYTSD